MGEWLNYNFAVESFHTKKLCSRFYLIEIEYLKIAFWDTLWGLRGNICTPFIAHWKAVVNFLFVIIERFRCFLRLRRYKPKSVEVGVFLRELVIWSQVSDGRGHGPLTIVGVRNLEWLSFRVVSKYLQCIVWFNHKARVWQTDRRTDRQNYDSQDRASIAAWCGKKTENREKWTSRKAYVLQEHKPSVLS